MKSKSLAAALLVSALALTGCAVGASQAGDEQASEGTTDTATTERVEIGQVPEWAANPVDVGELVATGYTENWQVDVFQVGTATTVSDSSWEDSETGENLLPAGSEIVVLNFVYTNTSGETQYTAINMGNPSFTTDSWKYYGGIPGENRAEHYEQFGMSIDFIATGAIEDFDHIAMEVAPGESVGESVTVQYITDEELVASVRIPATTADGETDFATVEEFTQELRFTLN